MGVSSISLLVALIWVATVTLKKAQRDAVSVAACQQSDRQKGVSNKCLSTGIIWSLKTISIFAAIFHFSQTFHLNQHITGAYYEVNTAISPKNSTTCKRTEAGIVSSSSSDFPSPSSNFQVNSCSVNAIARGNSSGRECKTSTAPGGGDTPKQRS